jgi:hypothetical protein
VEEQRRHDPLAELAARQYGVVSRRQLADLGYTSRAVDVAMASGRLRAVHQSVVAVGHGGLARRGKCMAAVLARGSGALLSHQSAAWLWGIEGSLELPVEVSVRWRGHRRDAVRLHHCPALRDEDFDEVDRIAVTGVPRTLLDRAAAIKPWWLERIVDRADRLRLLDVAAVDRLLGDLHGHRGRVPLQRALELYRDDGFFRSGGERRLVELFREAGIPRPYVNTWVEGHEIDLFWENEQFAVELDSWEHHRTRRSFEEDRKRQEDFAAAGIEMVRITGRRLTQDPTGVAVRLKAMLDRRREYLSARVRTYPPITGKTANSTGGAGGEREESRG